MEIAQKVALVTGGARRVGRTLSLALARAGADIVINHHASPAEAEETARAIGALGRRAHVVRADLSDAAAPARLVDSALEWGGRLDILVNNAALFESSPVAEITAAAWDRVFAVNLRAPFLLAQAAAPHLAADGGGVIVNIADLSAFQPWRLYAHHAASKAGLVQLTRVLARALAPNVRVNCIAPGAVLPPGDMGEEALERTRRKTPLGRIGSPDDVARGLLYLVEADFVTGEVLVVDGGRVLS